MIVTCPQCETSFSMPDELYKPGRKARCSNCSHVFRLPDLSAKAEPAEEKPSVKAPEPQAAPRKPKRKFKLPFSGLFQGKGKKGTILMYALLFLFCLGLVFGAWKIIGSFFGEPEEEPLVTIDGAVLTEEELQKKKEIEARVSGIMLENVRQYILDNDNEYEDHEGKKKYMKLVVIQGEVVNKFDVPKSLIKVRATLYDEQRNVLAYQDQYCGVILTLFQLKVLNARDLADAMKNRVAVVAGNTNIRPGARIPFMVVFAGVPEKLRSFDVQPIDAHDVEPVDNPGTED